MATPGVVSPGIAEILEIRDETEFAIALGKLVFARYESVGFEGLRPAERIVHCVDGLERDVNNGGFSQFFFNSPGNQTQETLAALQEIGAEHTARLVERAMSVFPGGRPSPDRSQRQDQLDALTEAHTAALSELDDQFYEYRDDLSGLVRAYVRAHQQDFQE
jgi:hypothetical protein